MEDLYGLDDVDDVDDLDRDLSEVWGIFPSRGSGMALLFLPPSVHPFGARV